jgi:hypothetical protein
MVGAMAATLCREDESVPSPLQITDSEYEDWIESRISVFMRFPERVFMTLLFHFQEALPKLDHLLCLAFNNDGIVFLPANEGRPGLPPARFPFASALAEGTAGVFGKAGQFGR